MRVTATLDGYQQVQRALRAMPPEARRQLTAGLKRAGELRLVPDARRRAPRASGALAASVQVYPQARGILFGSRRVYAPVQEFGGTIVHHGPRHRHTGAAGKLRRRARGADGIRSNTTTAFGKHLLRIEAQGYLFPALRSKRRAVLEDLSNALIAAARRVGLQARSL